VEALRERERKGEGKREREEAERGEKDYLKEATAVEEVADELDDLGSGLEGLAYVLVNQEIEVAVAVASLHLIKRLYDNKTIRKGKRKQQTSKITFKKR